MINLDLQKRQLCDIQGRLFELALKAGYDSPAFMKTFMNSKTAAALDDVYDRLQWAGEEYILEELNDEAGGLKRAGEIYSIEVMYWAGYLYRYWHYYRDATSKSIYEIADAKAIKECWMGFHTLDVEMAIDNFIEIKEQNRTLRYKLQTSARKGTEAERQKEITAMDTDDTKPGVTR